MVQRIQTIWLLLAAITILGLLFVPVLSASVNNTHYTLYGTGLTSRSGGAPSNFTNIPLFVSTVLAGLISLVNIFNFRNRKLQIRIASLNILLILGLSFWLSQLGKNMPGGLEQADIHAGLFLPIVAISFTLLAIRGVKQDEKLIKSADRLR